MKQLDAADLTQALFEEGGDALILFDPESDELLDANPMAQRLTGFSEAELRSMPATSLIQGEDRGNKQRLRQAANRTGLFHSQEGFLLRTNKEGVWIPVNITITRLHLKPKTLGLITARDIREQREAHARLKKVEAEMRHVLSSVFDCLWSADVEPNGKWTYRYISPVVEKIAGRPPEYYLQSVKRWWETVHPDDRDRWQKALNRLRSGEAIQEEYRVILPDGSPRWVRESVKVTREVAGRFYRLGGVLTDITERKQAEERIRQSEERYQELFENANDSVYTHDLAGNFTSFNKVGEQLTGYTREEILKMNVLQLLAPEHRETAKQMIARKLAEGGSTRYELEIVSKNGRRVPVEVNTRLIFQDGKPMGVQGISRDITERKQAEEALRQANQMLEMRVQERTAELQQANQDLARARDQALEASLAKSTFLANMSHELRTPLNAIIGYSEMLQEETANLGPQVNGDLGKIHRAGQNLLRLISDILDLAKIDAGKMEINLERFDPAVMIRDLLSTFRPLAEQNKNTVTISCADNVGSMCSDRIKVRQMLYHLLQNACKFTENGTIALEAARDHQEEEDWIRFQVKDSGIGIPPEKMDTVFKEFTQGDGSTTRRYGGTGLGLAITQRFCHMLRGKIQAQSAPGKGSIFWLELPANAEKNPLQ